MNRIIILILATLMLATTPIPAEAQTPECRNGQASDSDGDGYGWENGATCIVVEDSSTNQSGSSSNSTPVTSLPNSCSYPDGTDNWGWNESSRTSCPPTNAGSDTNVNQQTGQTTTSTGECSYPDGTDNWGWNETTRTSCPPTNTNTNTNETGQTTSSAPSDPFASSRGRHPLPAPNLLRSLIDTLTAAGGCDYSAPQNGWGWSNANRQPCPPDANVKAANYDPRNDPDLATMTVNVDANGERINLSWETFARAAKTNADGYLVRRLTWEAGRWEPVNGDLEFTEQVGANLQADTQNAYIVVPFKLNPGGEPRIFFGQGTRPLGADTTPPGERPIALDRLVNQHFRNATEQEKSQALSLVWSIHYRSTTDGIDVEAYELMQLRLRLDRQGFDHGLGDVSYYERPDLVQRHAVQLMNRFADYIPRTLPSFIPVYSDRAFFRTAYDVGEFRESLGTTGIAKSKRRGQFDMNQTNLKNKLEALPNPPKNASQVREIQNLAYTQARLILNVGANNKELWKANGWVTNGYHPTTKQLIHYTQCPGAQRPYPPGAFDDEVWCDVAARTIFSDAWNASDKNARLAYFGFSEIEWEFARPFIELSREMDRVGDRLEDKWTPLLKILNSIIIATVTAGAASALYAAAFGVAATSTAAVVTGTGASTYFSTLYLTGSTAQAEKALVGAILTAGLSHYSKIPTASLTTPEVFAIAALEGGVEVLRGGDFKDGFLESLATHYVPGVGDFLESLDNVSPFAAQFGEVLIGSLIENDFEWTGAVSDDLESYLIDYVGESVGNYVGDILPESWTDIGTSIGTLTVLSLSGADSETVRTALNEMLGQQLGNQVRSLIGNEQTFATDFMNHLANTVEGASDLDASQRAGYIDRQMRSFVFGQAAEALSGSFESWLVSRNNNQSSRLIEFGGGLVEVSIANIWKDKDERSAALNQYLSNEAVALFNNVTPGCLPQWATDMGSSAVATLTSGGNSDQLLSGLQSQYNQTLNNGGFNDRGTCGAPVTTNPENPGNTTCSGTTGTTGTGGNGFSPLVVGLPVLRVQAPIDPNSAGICLTSDGFREWLKDLQIGSVTNYVDVTLEGAYTMVTPKSSQNINNYRLRIVPITAGFYGEVVERNGQTWISTGKRVSYSQNSQMRINNFFEYNPDLETVLGPEGSNISNWRVWRFLDGCRSAVTMPWSDLRDAFVELWETENLTVYLQTKWRELQAMIAAFGHNPSAFFQEFLTNLIQLDLLRDDPDQWAGMMTCQFAMGIIPGYAATKFATLFAKFRNPAQARDRFIQDNPNEPNRRIPLGCLIENNSFPAGTPVIMEDGTLTAIEMVKPGERVITYDTGTKTWGSNIVLAQWSGIHHEPMATIELLDGSEISSTDDHEFWVNSRGAWIEADEVQVGDFLLAPDGVAEVSHVTVHEPVATEVWELDTAVDDNFVVHTGQTGLLVHNAPLKCHSEPISPRPAGARTFGQIMPNGEIPTKTGFDSWWDRLTPDELDWLNDSSEIRKTLNARYRAGGGQHEWCMCSRLGYIKRNWPNVSMAEIKAFTNNTRDINGTLPDRIADLWKVPRGTPWQHVTSSYKNSPASNEFHLELEQLIFESRTASDFTRGLPDLIKDWGIDENLVNIPNW